MPRAPVWKEKQAQYIQRCSDRLLSENTLKNYGKYLRYCYRYAVAENWPLNPAKIEPHHIRELYYHMVDEGSSTSKQREYIKTLLRFLKFCQNRNCEEIDLRIAVSRTRVNWLSEEEVAHIIASADYAPLRGALVLMAYCGLRRDEVVTLRRANIKMDQLKVVGKGRKERIIPLDRAFWDAMEPYTKWADQRPRTDFFLSYQHLNRKMYDYTPDGLGALIWRFAKEIGVTFTGHTLRRSFGRHLYKRGCPIAELQRLMGHASLEMTVRYLGIGEEDIAHAMSFRPDYLGGLK